MNKNAEKFLKENFNTYVKDFCDYWVKFYDYTPLEEDIKKEFKYFMYDYKNIEVNYRYSIFKNIVEEIEEKIIEMYLQEE